MNILGEVISKGAQLVNAFIFSFFDAILAPEIICGSDQTTCAMPQSKGRCPPNVRGASQLPLTLALKKFLFAAGRWRY
jgi:hypothetical protein